MEDFILQVAPNAAAIALGITVSKKIGNAVTRNRARRRLRAAWCACATKIPSGSYVMVAKPTAVTESFISLCAQLKQALQKSMETIV